VQHDLEVNVRAGQEIEVIQRPLEYQNTMLIAMVQKLGIDVGLHNGRSRQGFVTIPSMSS
jgi:hypothetical protein